MAYPASADNLRTDYTATDRMDEVDHAGMHNATNAAVNAIEAELGTNPSGTYPTVAAAVADSVKTADPKLTDARTPLAHKSTHASGGSDVLTPADIGAAPTTRAITAGTGLTGGGTLAADQTISVTAGGIGTIQLANGSVTGAKIAEDTITAGNIAPNAVGASELADNAVDTAALADGSVTDVKLATGAFSLSKVTDAAAASTLGNLLSLNQAKPTSTGAWPILSSATESAAGVYAPTTGGASSASAYVAVTPGQTYTVLANLSMVGRSGRVAIFWRDAGGATISTASGTVVPAGTAGRSACSGVAPVGAVTARVFPFYSDTGNASGDSATVYEVSFHRGVGGAYADPGRPVTGLRGVTTISAVTASVAMSSLQDVLTVDTTSGAVVVTLPAASECTGQAKRIIKTGGANALTVSRAGSETISPSSGTRTQVAFPSGAASGEIVLVSSGTGWHVVSGQASDETVGRRLWKWDQALAATSSTAGVGFQMFYGSTGWLDVSSLLHADWVVHPTAGYARALWHNWHLTLALRVTPAATNTALRNLAQTWFASPLPAGYTARNAYSTHGVAFVYPGYAHGPVMDVTSAGTYQSVFPDATGNWVPGTDAVLFDVTFPAGAYPTTIIGTSIGTL